MPHKVSSGPPRRNSCLFFLAYELSLQSEHNLYKVSTELWVFSWVVWGEMFLTDPSDESETQLESTAPLYWLDSSPENHFSNWSKLENTIMVIASVLITTLDNVSETAIIFYFENWDIKNHDEIITPSLRSEADYFHNEPSFASTILSHKRPENVQKLFNVSFYASLWDKSDELQVLSSDEQRLINS